MSESKKDALLVGIAVAAVGGLITGIFSILQLTQQANEFRVQEQELAVMKNQTGLMREALVKQSHIVMYAIPRTGFDKEESTTYTIKGGANGTASVIDVTTSPQVNIMRLHENETFTINVFLTNVGNSVAYLDSYHVNIVPELGTNITNMIGTLQNRIDTVLQPDSKVMSFPITITVSKDFAPKGKIVIEVLHDSGINKVLLEYNYIAE